MSTIPLASYAAVISVAPSLSLILVSGERVREHTNNGCVGGYHSACVWPTALKLSCVSNFDMLFLVMGFISLIYKIQFMLITAA